MQQTTLAEHSKCSICMNVLKLHIQTEKFVVWAKRKIRGLGKAKKIADFCKLPNE